MTRFPFRLDAALRLRRMKVESEKAALCELIAQRTRLEKSLTTAGEERAEASAYVYRTLGMDGVDLRTLSCFTLGVEARMKTLSDARDRLARQIAAQKQALLRAEQDYGCLEKLRTKRLADWRRETERELEATSQELWLFSHTTNQEKPRMQSDPEA